MSARLHMHRYAVIISITLVAGRPSMANAEPTQVFIEDAKVELRGWNSDDAGALGKALAAQIQGAVIGNPDFSPMTFDNLKSQLRKEKQAQELSCRPDDQVCMQKILDNYGCQERVFTTVLQVGDQAQITLTRYSDGVLVPGGAANAYAKPEMTDLGRVAIGLARQLFKLREIPRATVPSPGLVGGGTVTPGVALDRGDTIVNALTDESRFLVITTEPNGARLWLNGSEIGTSPKQLDQMVGHYVVTAELDRLYHQARQEVDLTTSGA